jgi:hypothetical protein
LCRQRKYPKKTAPLSQNTASLMKLLGRSGYRTSLPRILTGGVHAATLRAQPALFQRSPVAPAWGFSTERVRCECLFDSISVSARGFRPHVLVRGGKAFLNSIKERDMDVAPGFAEPGRRIKTGHGKRSDRHMSAPARVSFLLVTFLWTRKEKSLATAPKARAKKI